MFLENNIKTKNLYMIYDEVDMMANPITCELNIPKDKLSLENIDDLYSLSKCLFEDIFNNNEFWKSIETKIENNKIHNYIFNLDEPTKLIIFEKYDRLIDNLFNITNKERLNNLINYIKDNYNQILNDTITYIRYTIHNYK
jgi:hypothetical protein